MQLTKHAISRAKERCGWNKKTVERMAVKALENGITHSESKGNLKRFMSKVFLRHGKANNSRIYGEFIFVFSGESLLTIVNLPNNLKKLSKL